MAYTNRLILLLFSLLLFSCIRNANDQKVSSLLPTLENSDDLFYTDQKLRFIPDSVGKTSNYYEMVEFDDKLCLAMVNHRQNSIDIYDIDATHPSLVQRVHYQKEGNEGIGLLNGFAWVNQDSIYTVSSPGNGNIIALVNVKGELLRIVKRKAIGEYFQISANNYAKVFYWNQKLFAMRANHIYVDKETNRRSLEQAQVENVINTITGEDIPFPMPLPESALEIYNIYYRNKGKGNQMVYSFRYDHYLYTRDFSAPPSVEYSSTALAKSKFIGHITPKTDDAKGQYWPQHTGSYFGVFYDPYRKVYYRIVQVPVDYNQDPITGDNIDVYNELPMSVIVLDEQFNVLGEQLFPAKQFDYQNSRGVFVHPKGLYISLNNPFNKDVKEDEIVFQLLELKPEVLAKRAE